MARKRYRKRYVSSRRYRKTGQMGTGSAVLILCALFLLYYYGLQILIGAAVIGVIIFAYKYLEKRKLLRSGIQDIDKMDGREFELYLGTLFKAHGYKTKVTQASGDYGADLVLKKGDWKIVVQAKRYKGKVGVAAVQQIVSAKSMYGADEAWVVTNNLYTEQAQRLANANRVKMIDRQALIRLINHVNMSPSRAEEAVVKLE